jgi:hypothetical protein
VHKPCELIRFGRLSDDSICTGCDGIAHENMIFKKFIDSCGVCGGDNSTCAGCDHVPNSGKIVDECGACDGPGGPCMSTVSVTRPLEFDGPATTRELAAAIAGLTGLPNDGTEVQIEVVSVLQVIQHSFQIPGAATDYDADAEALQLRNAISIICGLSSVDDVTINTITAAWAGRRQLLEAVDIEYTLQTDKNVFEAGGSVFDAAVFSTVLVSTLNNDPARTAMINAVRDTPWALANDWFNSSIEL